MFFTIKEKVNQEGYWTLAVNLKFDIWPKSTESNPNYAGGKPIHYWVMKRFMGPWTVTGEISAFLGYHAPYSAIADREGLVYRPGGDLL
jgi:hypothetical protein